VADAAHENPLTRQPAEVWVEICSALTRGLNHLLSNRVSALGAVATLLDPSEDPDEEMVRALSVEVGRLDRTLRLMRFMPRDERSTPEPVRVEELLPEVVAIHEHHPELREIACLIAGSESGGDAGTLPDIPPVWVSPNAFVHAGLVLVTGAKAHVSASGSASDTSRGGAEISVSAEGGWVVVRVAAAGDRSLVRQPAQSTYARTAAWLLGCGEAVNGAAAAPVAEVHELAVNGEAPRGFEMRLITLVERRRRERGAGPA
jgi:hypothetical protein